MVEQGTYTSVRRRLDQRGYRQSLDASSLPLVESLLTDLIHATDQLKALRLESQKSQESNTDHQRSSANSDRVVRAKLQKENLELRQRIAKLKDDADQETKALKDSLQKHEIEQTDLRQLTSQYHQKLRRLEKELKQKSDEIQQMMGPKGNGVQEKETKIKDSLTGPAEESIADFYDLDLIRFAEKRIIQLEDDLSVANAANNDVLRELNDLKTQFDDKCDEVQRLHNFIDMPRGCGCIHAEMDHLPHRNHCHGHHHHEIGDLHHINQDLDKKLKEALNSYEDARNKNADLETRIEHLQDELTDVDRVAQALRQQKDELVNTADKEMSEAKKELERLYRRVNTLEMELGECRMDEHHEERSAVCDDQQGSVDKLQIQIRTIEDKLQRVLLKEQALQDKLAQLERSTNGDNIPTDAADVSQLVVSTENQRNGADGHVEQRHAGSTPITMPDVRRLVMDEALVKLLEEERDLYKNECLKLMRAVDQRDGISESVHVERQPESFAAEKRELESRLAQLNMVIEENNRTLCQVTADNERLKAALLQADAGSTVERNAVSPEDIAGGNRCNFIDFYNMQEERNNALANLKRVSSELDDVRNRLKLATQTQITERERLENKIGAMDAKLLLINGERADLLAKVSSNKLLMDAMEEQVETLQIQMMNVQRDLLQAQTEASRMKTRAEQTEQALKDAQNKLIRNASDTDQAQQIASEFQKRIEELNQVITKQNTEATALRNSVVALDREKDVLLMEVDNRAEKIAALQQEILLKSNDVSDLKATISNLESQIDRRVEELHDKDIKVKTLERQLDTAVRETIATKRTYEEVEIKNRELKEDLMVMTRENETISKDVKKSKDNQENLMAQLQNYVAEVSRVEELLRNKELERTQLLEQFRSLTSTTTDLESHNSVLEGEASSVRLELLSKESELSHAKETVDALNREIDEYFQRQQQIEGELLALRRNLGDSDARCAAAQQDRERLQRDLAAMRELCARLDESKEKAVQELCNKKSQLEKAVRSVEELRLEADQQRSRLSTQHVAIESLEDLLANNRQQEFETQFKNQQLATEIATLKDKMSQLETELERQIHICARNQTRVVDLEREVEQLHRELTSARFERERVKQELKRLQIVTSPTEMTMTTTTTTTSTTTSVTDRTGVGREMEPN